jgi:hypothetical protein
VTAQRMGRVDSDRIIIVVGRSCIRERIGEDAA